MCQECVINPFSLVTVSNTVHEQRTDPEIVQKCDEWGKNALQPFYCES